MWLMIPGTIAALKRYVAQGTPCGIGLNELAEGSIACCQGAPLWMDPKKRRIVTNPRLVCRQVAEWSCASFKKAD